MGDIASRFLNVYGPNVTGEYNSDMHCPPASGTPAWEAPHMGGRSWACKHGKNDEDMTKAAPHSATEAQRRRVKNFTLEILKARTIFQFACRATASAGRSA
jgi:hypothetical protein